MNREKAVQDTCREGSTLGLFSSAHDCAEGGLIIALAECCLAGKKGIIIAKKAKTRNDGLLFGESQSRIVVSLPQENLVLLQNIAEKYKTPLEILGQVEGDSLQFDDLIDLKIDEVRKAWERYFYNA